MSSSATGVGMPICFLGAILLILTQKSSQKFGDVLGIGKEKETNTRCDEVRRAPCEVWIISVYSFPPDCA